MPASRSHASNTLPPVSVVADETSSSSSSTPLKGKKKREAKAKPEKPHEYTNRTTAQLPSTRSIRALHDSETVTLYQAYNAAIATGAVATQTLSAASPLFQATRMTWFKPSWTWMMYRSGYSYKDVNQERILAVRVAHDKFRELLGRSRIAGEERTKGEVVVQWDPERTWRIGRVEGVRSIQIGVPGSLVPWLEEGVVGIEDVTERARGLKRVVDQEEKGEVEVEELMERGLMPEERVYDMMLSRELRERLGMRLDLDDQEEEEGKNQGRKRRK